ANTALAFVGLDHKGDRSFSFYRSPSADMLYTESDLPTALQDAFALHFCSVALGDSPMKDAHRRAIALAKEAGALISFDVNLRFSLWESEDALYRAVWEFLPSADILKLSEEEIGFVTGTKDLEKAAKMLLTHCRYVIITRGKDGAMLFYTDKKNGMTTIAAPSIEVNTIDTTGAGDAFIGAFLYLLSSQTLPLDALDNGILSNLLLYANRIAAATTEYHGAIDSYQTVFSHL
ncbi:MAG: carbohydrate kinase, partial [Clostridia bacterium]|nr:carbohydrate kinase [Clostridia bacterium]